MTEPPLDPRYITFDCYGTLTHFQMSDVTRGLMSDQIGPDQMENFLDDFEAYRFDEVIGPYKPYAEVLTQAFQRACRRWDVAFRAATVVGFFGAGGMGWYLKRNVLQIETHRVAAILLSIVVLVLISEAVSAFARARVAKAK